MMHNEEEIDLEEDHLEFLKDYQEFVENDLYLYNSWKKSSDDNEYFGGFPKKYMKNLLYYHTKPLDLIYDPFAGSGTTIFACQEMYRKYYATEIGERYDYNQSKVSRIENKILCTIPKLGMMQQNIT